MTPHERGAAKRERRRLGLPAEMTKRQRELKGSPRVKLNKYNWNGRAVRHLLSLWAVPNEDRDLLACGKREYL